MATSEGKTASSHNKGFDGFALSKLMNNADVPLVLRTQPLYLFTLSDNSNG